MAPIRKINSLSIIIIFLLIGIISLVTYVGINTINTKKYKYVEMETPILAPPIQLTAISTRNSPSVILDPYGPPLRNDGVYFPKDSADIRGGVPLVPCDTCLVNREAMCPVGIPINIETRGSPMEFTQVGILTRGSGRGDQVLSLMGRKLMNGPDKWQYYTLTNSGIMPTKVSIYRNGRDAMGEYGIDRLYDGDNVFVDGYEEVYRAKMYENSTFRYIPFI